jgi:hypothetical protein
MFVQELRCRASCQSAARDRTRASERAAAWALNPTAASARSRTTATARAR